MLSGVAGKVTAGALVKEMNCRTWNASHHPHPTSISHACDERSVRHALIATWSSHRQEVRDDYSVLTYDLPP